jgi:hypothetical protein
MSEDQPPAPPALVSDVERRQHEDVVVSLARSREDTSGLETTSLGVVLFEYPLYIEITRLEKKSPIETFICGSDIHWGSQTLKHRILSATHRLRRNWTPPFGIKQYLQSECTCVHGMLYI